MDPLKDIWEVFKNICIVAIQLVLIIVLICLKTARAGIDLVIKLVEPIIKQ